MKLLIAIPALNEEQSIRSTIQRCLEAAPADLLGFLDADGTCDPNFFATLCRNLVER